MAPLRSLKFRIAFTIFALELVMMVVALWQTSAAQTEAARAQQLATQDAVLKLVERVCRTALLTDEFGELRFYFEHLQQDPNVERVMLGDARGRIVGSADVRELGQPLPAFDPGEQTEWRVSTLDSANGRLGTLAVQFSSRELLQAQAKARKLGFAIAAVGMTLIALVGMGMGVLLTRRLGQLAEAARRMAAGDRSMRAGLRGHDEVAAVGQAFDDMADAVTRQEQQLREQREYTALLLESTAEAIFGVDTEGRCTFANPACLRMLGYEREEDLIGRNMHALIHHTYPDGRPYPKEECRVRQSTLAGVPAHSDEEVHWRADGTLFPVEYWSHPMHRNGQLIGAVVTFVDITERKRAEDSLRASHALLDAIGHVQSLYIAGADPRVVFDGMLSALLATTESEYGFIGEVLREADGTPYLKTQAITNIAWDEATRAFYAANAPEGMEFRNLQTLFGAAITSAQPVLSNDPAKDPRGRGIPPGHPPLNAFMGLPFFRGEELVGMVGVANRQGGYRAEMVARLQPFLSTCASVTQAIRENQRRRRAEEALRESEARLRAAIESIPFDFFLIGATGRYVLQNSISRKLWGEVVGKRPEDVTDDAAMLAHWNSNHRRAFAGEVVAEEVRFTVGNEERYIHNIIAPVKDHDEIRGIVGLNIDVTDHRRAEEDLLESEARFRLFMQHFPGLAYIKDSHTRTLFANRGFETYLDLAPSEMVGKTNAELFPAEFAAQITAGDRRILESGQYEEREERYGGRDWSALKFALHRPGRTPLLGGLTLDITERKRAEEALRRSNRQLRMLSDCNQALIRITDEMELLTTICTITVREGGYRMAWVGYAEQDAPKTIRPMAHAGFEEGYLQNLSITWADDERGLGPMGTAIRTGRPGLVQNIASDSRFSPWRAEAAKRGYAAVCALPLTAGDQIVGALGIYSSVPDAFDAEEIDLLSELASDLAFGIAVLRTRIERERAEQKLLESEHKYRELVENANSIILRWNRRGEITFINEFGLKFFGYSPEEVVGQHVVGTIVPADESTGRDLCPLMDDICLHPEQFERNVNENMRRGGERVWVSWTNKAVPDERGQIVEVFSVGSDITERKRAEEELQRYREHLEDLVAERTAELRQAMNQLVQSEKLAALGQLVAGIAHELNTPLGNARVVAGSLDEHLREFAAAAESGALRRSQLDAFLARGREAVAILERNAARAADLIAHFKQVAVDQTSARRRRFPLRQTVEELLATLRPQLKHTAHRVELDIPPDIELDSYPGPLEQVLANLVTNSLTHGFAGTKAGAIRLQARALDPAQVLLRYADNGVGIPDAIRHRIFEPFFTTRLGQGGSGLGLYIVYNLVTGVLGGTVRAESAPGQGATFILTLPRAAPDRPTAEPTP